MTRGEDLDSKENYSVELTGFGDGYRCAVTVEVMKDRNSDETQ